MRILQGLNSDARGGIIALGMGVLLGSVIVLCITAYQITLIVYHAPKPTPTTAVFIKESQ